MSILADRQIKELCTVPSWAVTTMVAQEQSDVNDYYMVPQPIVTFSHQSEKELIKNVNQYLNSANIDRYPVGTVSFRPLTTEEQSSFRPMISPYEPGQVRTELRAVDVKKAATGGLDVEVEEVKIISYGTSSYGYDVRIADEFKIFTNVNTALLDPKDFNDKSFVDHKGPFCIIPPNSFVLARTMERFCMPPDVTGVVLGKSTYARVGISCLATPLEAGWEGELVLEYANTTPLPVKLYANEGAAQILFFKGDVPCEVSYATRGGKYQGQTGITTAKV